MRADNSSVSNSSLNTRATARYLLAESTSTRELAVPRGRVSFLPICRCFSWELQYSCRSREDAAFLQNLRTLRNVHHHFDDENQGPGAT